MLRSSYLLLAAFSVSFLGATTPSSAQPAPIVIDNTAATLAGSWSTGTSAADKYGSNYYFRSAGATEASVQFTPSISQSGRYKIYEWHCAGSNRCPNATVRVLDADSGTQTFTVNQTINGGTWVPTGIVEFLAGTSGNVKIVSKPGTTGVTVADGIKIVWAPDMIVDNENAGFSASSNWSTATSAADKYGASYRYRSTAAVTDQATYNFNLPDAGEYDVYAWYCQGSNRSTVAPYTVSTSTGNQTVTLNQQTGGGGWRTVGIFRFNAGANTVKVGCNAPSGFIVVADAVMLVPRRF